MSHATTAPFRLRKVSLRSLRLLASFSLLGAVIAGTATGWIDHQSVDFRAWGAGVGLVAGVVFKLAHII